MPGNLLGIPHNDEGVTGQTKGQREMARTEKNGKNIFHLTSLESTLLGLLT